MSKFLVGKVITGVKIAADKKALQFTTDDGIHVVKTDGDCCSSSWIESVELPAMGFPAMVTDVVDLDMPDQEYDEDSYECIAFYGCKITTDKGDLVIDYRNESNGYYGGNLSWPDSSYFYGGVHGQNISEEEWKEISDVQ